MTAQTTVFSMTGFGRGGASRDALEVNVEIKSVNHRFLDAVCRLPSPYARFEPEIQRILKNELKRGRIEVMVARADRRPPNYEVAFNDTLFEQYLNTMRSALKRNGIAERKALGVAVANILGRREVLEIVPRDETIESEWQVVEEAVRAALKELIGMRRSEGHELWVELERLLNNLEEGVGRISQLVERAPIDFQERLRLRLERVLPTLDVDPDRLAQEVAILADRADVTEELVRLQSHFLQFRKTLSSGEGGRKLEFLLQEFGREINTIGSKSQNSEVTAEVVDAKATVEKLREQVQNVE